MYRKTTKLDLSNGLLLVQSASIRYAVAKSHETRVIFTVNSGVLLRDSAEYRNAVKAADDAYDDLQNALKFMQDLIDGVEEK